MGADNVDIFKKIIFSLPDLKYQIAAMLLLSPIYTGIAYVSFDLFTPVELELVMIPIFALLVFLMPFALAGELFHRIIPGYPRKWSFFLSLTNQLVIFLYSLILSGADNVGNAWSIIWLTLITITLTNILVLTMSNGTRWIKRIIPISFTQPLTLLVVFHFFLGRSLEIPALTYAFNFAALLVAVVFLVVLLKLVDYLIGSNTEVSAFELTSGLLQDERESLDTGYEARPDVQTLQIENGEKATLAAPWVHPGPLGGFGGGKLSDRMINYLNEDGKGFFLHVPCTHKEDLADPDDAEKIKNALEEPKKTSRASEMITKEYDGFRFYGRRIGDKKMVYLDADEIDDYHTAVFMEDRDREDVLLIDLHNHDIHEGPEKEVQYGTVEAEKLKNGFEDFLEELDELELHEYSAGFEVGRSEHPIMATVEEVNGQKVLVFGIDTNGVTEDMRELREEYSKEYDYSLLFSTDTHSSIYDLANMKHSEVGKAREVIEKAGDNVSDASIGFTNTKTEALSLLKLDYSGLVFSINILIRLVVISLAFLYLLLILWIF